MFYHKKRGNSQAAIEFKLSRIVTASEYSINKFYINIAIALHVIFIIIIPLIRDFLTDYLQIYSTY